MNSFFREKDIHKYTCNARVSRFIIDYVLPNNKISKQVEDVQVYRVADIYTDHYLLIAKIAVYTKWKNVKITM